MLAMQQPIDGDNARNVSRMDFAMSHRHVLGKLTTWSLLIAVHCYMIDRRLLCSTGGLEGLLLLLQFRARVAT